MWVAPLLEFTRKLVTIVQKIEGCILHSVSVSEKKDTATIWYSLNKNILYIDNFISKNEVSKSELNIKNPMIDSWFNPAKFQRIEQETKNHIEDCCNFAIFGSHYNGCEKTIK